MKDAAAQGPAAGGFDFGGFDWGAFGGAGGPGAAGANSGGSFRDILGDLFGGGRPGTQARPTAQRGADLEVPLAISFEDAINGKQTEIRIRRNESCATCHGSGETGTAQVACTTCQGTGKLGGGGGFLRFDQACPDCGGTGKRKPPCPSCHGTGTVSKTETVKVRIPAGVDTGSRVRVAGKGHAGTRGGPSGDLYIVTNVAPHRIFTRKGDNIYCTIPITLPEAALGAKIEVPTVSGKAQLRIPPGTQSGQRFRLREKGAPSLRSQTRGDEYVEVKVVLPKIIDEDSKELLRQFAKRNGENPRSDLGLE